MALKSNALTTVDRLKTWLGITTSEHDTVIEHIINSASQYLENRTGRKFKKQTHTNEILDSDGSADLFLKHYPVITFTRLQVRRNQIGSNDWDTIDSDEYYVDLETGVITIGSSQQGGVDHFKFDFHSEGRFFRGVNRYRATYDAGFDFDLSSTFPPSDLEAIVWKMGSIWYNSRQQGDNVKSLKLGDYQVTFAKLEEENPEIRAMIEYYMRFDF